MAGCKIDYTVRVPLGDGTCIKLSKEQAIKQLTWLLDEQAHYWCARRLDDQMELLEQRTFTTLRDAIDWLLRWDDAIRNAGCTLIDAILLAHELGLLYGLGEISEYTEIPHLWQMASRIRGGEQVI